MLEVAFRDSTGLDLDTKRRPVGSLDDEVDFPLVIVTIMRNLILLRNLRNCRELLINLAFDKLAVLALVHIDAFGRPPQDT